jgi:hypothetical protein
VDTNKWEVMPPMFGPRSDASAVVHNGRIYVCGGMSFGTCMVSIECYDSATGRWTQGPLLSSARAKLSAVSYNGHLAVLGGSYDDPANPNAMLSVFEYYDETHREWIRLPDMLKRKYVLCPGIRKIRIYEILNINY